MPTPSDEDIYETLLYAVEFSINTDGYKWVTLRDQGGWAPVLQKYPHGTPDWPEPEKKSAVENTSSWRGGGRGRNQQFRGK